MDIRVPSGGQLSLQSIMTKFELGLANESQRNLSRASQKTALRHKLPVTVLAMGSRISPVSIVQPQPHG
jgi:hypothetical protein